MVYDLSLMQGGSVAGFCNLNYLSNNMPSYILILMLVVGLFIYGSKKNYTIYTITPVVFTVVFFVSLFIYTLDCDYQRAIHGQFVVASLFLLAISVFIRHANK